MKETSKKKKGEKNGYVLHYEISNSSKQKTMTLNYSAKYCLWIKYKLKKGTLALNLKVIFFQTLINEKLEGRV